MTSTNHDQPTPDIAALLDALRADVRARRLAQGRAEPTSRARELQRALDEIELYRVVSAHWPLVGTTLPQRALNLVNKLVRRGLRWYINPIVEQQNAYNDSVARALRLLAEAYADLAETGDRGQGTGDRRQGTGAEANHQLPITNYQLPITNYQALMAERALLEPPARFPELALAGAAGQLALCQTVSAHWALGGATLAQRLVALAQMGTRRYLRWLVNPLVEQQNAANAALTGAVLALMRVDAERRAASAALRAARSQELGVRSQNVLTPDS